MQNIITIPTGTRVRYTFTDSIRTESGPVAVSTTIEGVKGDTVGMSRLGNQGFWIVADDGAATPISRYAKVETV